MHVTRAQGGEVVVVLESELDGAGALRLRGVLVEAGEGERVVVDFRRLRHVSDVGLARLARELARTSVRVELRGLGLHQERMLRYLGVDVHPFEAGAEAAGV
jgi:anti-anti-sigma regulatory factor